MSNHSPKLRRNFIVRCSEWEIWRVVSWFGLTIRVASSTPAPSLSTASASSWDSVPTSRSTFNVESGLSVSIKFLPSLLKTEMIEQNNIPFDKWRFSLDSWQSLCEIWWHLEFINFYLLHIFNKNLPTTTCSKIYANRVYYVRKLLQTNLSIVEKNRCICFILKIDTHSRSDARTWSPNSWRFFWALSMKLLWRIRTIFKTVIYISLN